jgi:hypothetical protein
MKERRSARCPRVAALVQRHPPKPPPRPAGGSHCLVGDRGHRKGQLRVLGSPSARHTKEPRTGGPPGGRGVRGPDFFLRKFLRTYLRVLITGLQTPRANRYRPSYSQGVLEPATSVSNFKAPNDALHVWWLAHFASPRIEALCPQTHHLAMLCDRTKFF